MKLQFGTEQIYASKKMQKSLTLAKMVRGVFGYTNIGNYARFTVFENILSQIPIDKMDKILDLGCGYGEYAFALARAYDDKKIIAIDPDMERIETINSVNQKLGLGNFTAKNKYLNQIEDDNFDLIYSIDVFEHIEEDQMPFQDAYKRLKKGGYLMIKIPNKTQNTILPEELFEEHHEWLEEEHIGQVYDLSALEERFKKEGFSILHSSETDGIFSRLAWEISYLAKKLGLAFHLMFLPISKLLIHLDRLVHNGKNGNSIHVLAQKI